MAATVSAAEATAWEEAPGSDVEVMVSVAAASAAGWVHTDSAHMASDSVEQASEDRSTGSAGLLNHSGRWPKASAAMEPASQETE